MHLIKQLMKLKSYSYKMSKKVAYFIGIGGAGMSSIASYLNKTGWNVSGYDKTEKCVAFGKRK